MTKRVATVGFVLGLLACLWYVNYNRQLEVTITALVPEDRFVFNMINSGQMRKYRINKLLPAGSTIKLWVETYEYGARVDDLAVCEFQLASAKRGIRLYSMHGLDGISLSIDGLPQATSHGQYPVDRPKSETLYTY